MKEIIFILLSIHLAKSICDNCRQCSNNYCFQCQKGFEQISGTCFMDPCLAKNPYNQACTQCKPGYDLNSNTCFISNCQLQISLNSCSKCSNQFQLSSQNGLCKPQNCQNYDFVSQRCIKCKNGFTISINNSCAPINCQKYLGSVCFQCFKGFQPNQLGGCIPQNCYTSSNFYNCDVCNQGFIADDNGKCLNHISFCQITNRFAPNQCTKCKQQFKSVNGICVKQIKGCSQISWKGCEQCIPGLIQQRKYGKCGPKFCEIQSQQNQLECFVCSDGFELTQNKICRSRNCKQYGKDGISCLRCFSRFYSKNQTCITNNCLVWKQDKTQCLTCQQSYILKDGACLLRNCLQPRNYICEECADGWMSDLNGLCSVRICQQYGITLQQCLMCPPGRRLQNNLCVEDQCILRYEYGTCIQCASQYILSVNGLYCIPYFCDSYDPDNGECLRCAHQFSISSDLGRCQSNLCLNFTNIVGYIHPQCTKCSSDQYQPFDAYCRPKQCIDYNVYSGKCLRCSMGFDLTENSTKCTMKNCEQFVENNKLECTKCKPGYSLNLLCFTEDCIQYQPNSIVCKTCSEGFYLTQNKVCRSDFCLQIDREEKCQKCKQGFKLTAAKTCQRANCVQVKDNKCSRCVSGFFRDILGGCLPYNCQNFDELNQKCLLCNRGFAVLQPGCAALDCIEYHPNLTCSKCRKGFALNEQTKTCDPPLNSFCPPGQFYDSAKRLCVLIPIQNCLLAYSNECIRCKQGYFAYYQTPNSRPSCVSLQNCQIQNDFTGCSKCRTGYVFEKGRCISSLPNCLSFITPLQCSKCQEGYQVNSNRKCSRIPPNCILMHSTGVCVRCQTGLTPLDNMCVKKTEGCERYVEQTGICDQCKNGSYLTNTSECKQNPQNCHIASSQTGYCLKCIQGKHFWDGKCVQPIWMCNTYQTQVRCGKCVEGYYVNANGKCEQLAQFCRSANIYGICISCERSYIAISGKCYKEIESCFSYNLSGSCTFCANGYSPSINGNFCLKNLRR